jgi:hypothetical protein
MVAPIDHGVWFRYQPEVPPEQAPSYALFAQRQSDNMDWYEYVHSGTNFQPTSVKFVVAIVQPTDTTSGYTKIQAPAVDPTMLFPSDNMGVVEMLGDYSSYTTNELIDQFANKAIDLTTGDITDPPLPPVMRTANTFDGLLKRIEALEQK